LRFNLTEIDSKLLIWFQAFVKKYYPDPRRKMSKATNEIFEFVKENESQFLEWRKKKYQLPRSIFKFKVER